ncbi:acyl-CoA dehydrogenase [Streptomyces sp. SID8379]|uniref:acyl-CoA dehydrogenase family protein n=1 Tax=unclassified Streptomyces TaxID=2593676 RepID=UPI000367C38A|nr:MULTISPECIES: acyl-CoA dehydrogenase family protein [unclassified Streptomyces]MYW69852.1 acyl-CoA dehydrogenase [Streptomyces sp. SID8379]
MIRTLFEQDHEDFREMVRTFLTAEIAPKLPEWEAAGLFPKDVYARFGELGLAGLNVPAEYGGAGVDDFRFNAVLIEEAAYTYASLGALSVHANIVTPYFVNLGTEEQKRRWLPGIAAAATLCSIAMSEPGTGSDLSGITTHAERDGDDWVLNGAKTFITGGINADLVLVACRTSHGEDRRDGLSLLVVEDGMPGFTKGRKLEKLGTRSTDTAELFFDQVRVPAANLLGEEGKAFGHLTANLVSERLTQAVGAVATARAALTAAVDYVGERKVFGKPVAAFQNTKFQLADCATEIAAAQALVDQAVLQYNAGTLTVPDVAMVKLFSSEAAGRVVDKCLQLHGGYGYMLEYPIARLYADIRLARIAAGSSEIMRTVIAKSLGL